MHTWRAQHPKRARSSLGNCISTFPEAIMIGFSAVGGALCVLLLRKLMHEKVKSEELTEPMLLSSI